MRYPQVRRRGAMVLESPWLVFLLEYQRPDPWSPFHMWSVRHLTLQGLMLGGCRTTQEVLAMKLPKVDESGVVGGGAFSESDPLSSCPELASALTSSVYSGTKTVRERSFFTLRFEDGVWKVTLRDPSSAMVLRVSCDNYANVPAALEGLLSSKKCPWEHDTSWKPRKVRK